MRKPSVKPGELHAYYGRLDGDCPDVIFHSGEGVPRCDRALLYCIFGAERLTPSRTFEPSFVAELEKRGYDMSTLRFRIQKKAQTP